MTACYTTTSSSLTRQEESIKGNGLPARKENDSSQLGKQQGSTGWLALTGARQSRACVSS
ncbi:hypothetical protein SETIT_7G277900v2 [Setaria italica]|nr:hypothetical protein SETIT_7G277900v2 [Setaria italica]TKW07151.1 hypothetical protein SEVIR_7G289000v2 [Setaria viridis]